MSRATKTVVIILLGLGLVFGAFFVVALIRTAGPHIARGAQVTDSGWISLISTFMGAFGLTGAGILTSIFNRVRSESSGGGEKTPEQELTAEVLELTSSFTALMKNKTNLAAQRRFVFALVDAARLITGVDVSHEGGVIVIRYRGFVPESQSVAEKSAAV